MTAALASARLLDGIILLVVAEAAGLALLHAWRGLGPPPAAVLPTLAAGGALLLALRLAWTGPPFLPVAVCLFGALVAHALDMRRRWRDHAALTRSRQAG